MLHPCLQHVPPLYNYISSRKRTRQGNPRDAALADSCRGSHSCKHNSRAEYVNEILSLISMALTQSSQMQLELPGWRPLRT
eukprot:7385124-Prymnesium_polylepis.1